MDNKYKERKNLENYINNIEPHYYKYNAVHITTPKEALPDIVLKMIKEEAKNE